MQVVPEEVPPKTDINQIPEVIALRERHDQMDRALRRLSMELGNPCIQWETESVDMGLVEYALAKINGTPLP